MTLQQKKARKFGQALDEFRQYKKRIEEKWEKGLLTRQEADILIREKAEELDL